MRSGPATRGPRPATRRGSCARRTAPTPSTRAGRARRARPGRRSRREVGERFFVEAGTLWFARREDGFEAHSIAALTSLGIPVRRLYPAELADGWPQIAVDDLAFAAYEPEAGLLLARNGVAAVARTFAADGGRFELGWAMPGASEGRRLRDVVTGDGTRYAGGTFVFAAGPWLPRLFPDVAGELIRVTKQDVMYFGPPPATAGSTPSGSPAGSTTTPRCTACPRSPGAA